MPLAIPKHRDLVRVIPSVYRLGKVSLDFQTPMSAFNFATRIEYEKSYNTFQSFAIFPPTHPLWSLGFAWDLKVIREENKIHLTKTIHIKLNPTQVALRTILLPRAHRIKCKDADQTMRFAKEIRDNILHLKAEKDLIQDTSDLTFHLAQNHKEILITSPYFEKAPLILHPANMTDLGPAPKTPPIPREKPTYIRQNETLRNFRETARSLRKGKLNAISKGE